MRLYQVGLNIYKMKTIFFLLFFSVVLHSVSISQQSTQCHDSAYWNHVYEPTNLLIIDSIFDVHPGYDSAANHWHHIDTCVTMSGYIQKIVLDSTGTIRLKLVLDSIYGKRYHFWKWYIWCNAICLSTPTVAGADSACAGIDTSIVNPMRIKVVALATRHNPKVRITGTFVYDEIMKWWEIHPITSLVIL